MEEWIMFGKEMADNESASEFGICYVSLIRKKSKRGEHTPTVTS